MTPLFPIPEQSPSSVSLFWFPLLALVISAAAVVVGPLLSRRNTKDQLKQQRDALEKQGELSMRIARLDFKKSFVSASRQAWIDELRHTLSELVGITDFSAKKIVDRYQGGPDDNTDKDALLRELSVLRARIELLLNPEKREQDALVDRVAELTISFGSDDPNAVLETYPQAKQNLLNQAKVIFKTEWDKASHDE